MLELHLPHVMTYLLARDLAMLMSVSRILKHIVDTHLQYYVMNLFGAVTPPPDVPLSLLWISTLESCIFAPEVAPKRGPLDLAIGKFQLVALDSVPALQRSLAYGCVLTPKLAEHARSVPMLEFFKSTGIKVPGDALTRALSRNDTVLSNWMIQEGIMAQFLRGNESIELTPAMIHFFTTSRNFNRMLLTSVTEAANKSGDCALVRQLYNLHKMLDVRGLDTLMVQSPLDFTEWALSIRPREVTSDLWSKAIKAERMDLLQYLAPKISPMLGPLNILAQHGTLAQLQWGVSQASERGWTTIQMVTHTVFSGSIPKIQYAISTGAEIPWWVGNNAINSDAPTVAMLDYLAERGYLSTLNVVKAAVTRTHDPLPPDVVAWCYAHYPEL